MVHHKARNAAAQGSGSDLIHLDSTAVQMLRLSRSESIQHGPQIPCSQLLLEPLSYRGLLVFRDKRPSQLLRKFRHFVYGGYCAAVGCVNAAWHCFTNA